MRTLPTRNLILATILALGTTGSAAAECSNADFAGRYGFMAQGQILQDGPRDIRPYWLAGTVHSDGSGVITEWKDTYVRAPESGVSQPVEDRDVIAFAAANGGSVTYEVTADCRITIQADLVVALIEIRGALMHGGQEVHGVQTSPEGFMAGGVFKSIDPPAASRLSDLKELLDRVAVRNGLRP